MSDEPWEDDFGGFAKPGAAAGATRPARARSPRRSVPSPGDARRLWPGAADEEDDFSSFGMPAGAPSADGASLPATEAATADDDDDEFSEFGVPAYPAVASSLPAIDDDDDDEFAEVLEHHARAHLFPSLDSASPSPPPPSLSPSPSRPPTPADLHTSL